MSERNVKIIVFSLFFLSGISGLIYEVVWTRMLTYVFGNTIFAVTTVLTAFMGGLALGSFGFGKLVDKWGLALKTYALLELGIGISAFLLPFVLREMTPVYKYIYQHYHASFYLFSLIRFVLTFGLLIIPTTMMGGTLPVLSKFFVQKESSLGLTVGGLYSANTFGAVTGCFLTGFYLIANFGMMGAIYIGVILNILIGLVGLSLTRYPLAESRFIETPTVSKETEEPYPTFVLKFVMFSFFISGFVALAYEVIWTRALTFAFDIMKNTTYAFTTMLTTFLIGLALGSFLCTKVADKEKDPLKLFSGIQILIGLSALLSIKMLANVGYIVTGEAIVPNVSDAQIWSSAIRAVFLKSFLVMILPTLLMGMTFPLVVKICIGNLPKVGEGLGKIYASNTFGSILGSFSAGFLIIPFVGLSQGAIFLALANIVIGGILFGMNPRIKSSRRYAYSLATIPLIAICYFSYPKQIKFQELPPTEKLVHYEEGRLDTVSVVETTLGYRRIDVDGIGVAGTDPILLTDQKSLAHIPVLLLDNPKSALTVGFGSGGASYSYTLYPELEKIHCVEISQTVLRAASYLKDSNHGVLELKDPRYGIVLDDARSYLLLTDNTYDIIATDCTDLKYKTNANLYDLEYFKLCRERITEDGMVVVWMPIGHLTPENFKMTLRTFYTVFPHMSVWFMDNYPTHYILLIGTKKTKKIDFQKMVERLQLPKVKKDLSEIQLDDVYKILSCFICDETNLKAYLDSGPLNTENEPRLEFTVPKTGYGDNRIIDNLEDLKKIKQPVYPLLMNIPLGQEKNIQDLLGKYEKANPYILEGHNAYRAQDYLKACDNYLEAFKLNPADQSVKHLLEFDEFKRRIERYPEDWKFQTIYAQIRTMVELRTRSEKNFSN